MYSAGRGLPVGGGAGCSRMSPGLLGGAVRLDSTTIVLRPLVPAVERRHLPDRLLGEQLHQLVDVVGLERGDVAIEQVLGLRRIGRQAVGRPRWGRPRRVVRGPAAAGCSPRPLMCRSRRPPRRPSTAARHATPAPPAAAGTGAAAPRRTPAAPTRASRRSSKGRWDRRIDPAAAPATAPRRVPSSSPAGSELGAPSPVGSGRRCRPSRRGQACVGGDPVQPGPQRRLTLEPAVGLPRAQVGLLHQIFGVVHGAGHPVAVRQQLTPMRLGLNQEFIIGFVCEDAHRTELTQTHRQALDTLP